MHKLRLPVLLSFQALTIWLAAHFHFLWLIPVFLCIVFFYLLKDKTGMIIAITIILVSAFRTSTKNNQALLPCVLSGKVIALEDTSFERTIVKVRGSCWVQNQNKLPFSGYIVWYRHSYVPLNSSITAQIVKTDRVGRFIATDVKIETASTHDVRESMIRWLYSTLDTQSANFVSCIVLGNRGGITPYVRRAFSELGISHLLALSGLHASIATFFFTYLISPVLILWLWYFAPASDFNKIRMLISSSIALLVSFIGLNHASSFRSFIFISLFTLTLYLNREVSSLTKVLAAAVVELVLRPDDLFTLSFIFSYSSVLGIVLFTPKLKNRLITYIFTPIAAGIFTMPLSYIIFHQTMVFSFPANLLFVPAFFPLIVLSMIYTYGHFYLPVVLLVPIGRFLTLYIHFFVSSVRFLSEITRTYNLPYAELIVYFIQLATIILVKIYIRGIGLRKILYFMRQNFDSVRYGDLKNAIEYEKNNIWMA